MDGDKRRLRAFELYDALLHADLVSDFMSKPAFTLGPTATMADAKELMRRRRISGIPIVDEHGHLMGLVSIENILIALENHQIEDSIQQHMVANVICLLDTMKVPKMIECLMTYNYGRYPVINHENKVVGVLTHGDVIQHVLERLGNVYLHDKRRDEILAPTHYPFWPKTHDPNQSFLYTINSTDLDRAGEGSTRFKRFLQQQGFPAEDTRRASIALYEAEINVVLHAHGKGRIRAHLNEGQLFVEVSDSGPGIEDIELAMQPGYSTASDEVRMHGFGAGMGLANIKKYSDKLVILSGNAGVKIEITILPNSGPSGTPSA